MEKIWEWFKIVVAAVVVVGVVGWAAWCHFKNFLKWWQNRR